MCQAVSVSLPHEAEEHEETDGHFGVRRRSDSELESDEDGFDDEEDAPRIREDDEQAEAILGMLPVDMPEHVLIGNGEDSRENRLLEDEDNGTPGLLSGRHEERDEDDESETTITEEMTGSDIEEENDFDDDHVTPTRVQIVVDGSDHVQELEGADASSFVEGFLGQQLLALDGFPPEEGNFLSEDQVPESDQMEDEDDDEDDEEEDEDDDDVDEVIRQPDISLYRSFPSRMVEAELQIGQDLLNGGSTGSNGAIASFYLAVPSSGEPRQAPPTFSSLSNAPETHVS